MFRFIFLKKLLLLTALFLLLIIFIFSWKTNPNVGEFTFLPHWLTSWADQMKNNRIRTAVPMIFLGVFSGYYLQITYKKKLTFWLFSILISSTIIAIAELGQYFIPSRQADVKDVIWGILGAILGHIIVYIIYAFITKFKKNYFESKTK